MKFQDLIDLAKIAQSPDAVNAILKTDREICEMLGRAVVDLFGGSIECGFDSATASVDGVIIPEQWCGAPISVTDTRGLVVSILTAIDEVPADAGA